MQNEISSLFTMNVVLEEVGLSDGVMNHFPGISIAMDDSLDDKVGVGLG